MPDRVEIPLVVRYEKAKAAIRELEDREGILVHGLFSIYRGQVDDPIAFAETVLMLAYGIESAELTPAT